MPRTKKYVKGFLRKTALLACFVLAAANMSCDSGKAYADGGSRDLRAMPVTEGIYITINDIPPETTRIFVNIFEWGEKDVQENPDNVFSAFTDIRGEALEQIKKSGRVIFPFAKSGLDYQIAVSVEKNNDAETAEWRFTECAAENGIFFNNSVELNLNNERTAVAMSAEPVFNAEVSYAPNKYRYGITVKKEEYWSIGVSDKGNENSLTWNFEPALTNELKDSGYLESGEYPAYAEVYCNLVHNNLTWSLEIAKSGGFTVSL